MVLLPIVSVVVIYAARIAELRTKRDTVPGPIRERLSFQLFFVVGVLVLVGAILEYLLRGKGFHWVWFGAGWAVALASFWIRRRAISALGRFWSLHVEIRDTHQFVQSGPFRWMRHPTYFSMILELLAVTLILQAFVTMLLIPLLYFPALVFRLRLEEPALVRKFGDAYREYQRRVPALFPYKWPHSS
ncbi:MAG: isoprenylcysteine carboxylmethyltransferase family protein [Verrucomicrobiota bacterium]|nr:isoprenylcysteine carboxylmethyltransferase family protein [Verrucomicrobiota bacterium]